MSTASVSFAIPSVTDSDESSAASSAITLDETTPKSSKLKAILDELAHIVVIPERLTVVEEPLARSAFSEIFLATLVETSQTPRNVIAKRFQKPFFSNSPRERTLEFAKSIKIWESLKHPNVLELLGYTLNPENEIDQIVSPYLINGNIREFLRQAPAGVAQRLGFVRDVTAGLDYLHSQSPPICHGYLNPLKILINDNFNAVLSGCGLSQIYSARSTDFPSSGYVGDIRYTSPEWILGTKQGLESDIWSWGCIAFEILTDKVPFSQHEGDLRVLHSVINRDAPGEPSMVLGLVPDAPKPEYASTLRSLHSYIPLCWEYEPRKRPPISLLRQRAFMFCFEDDAGDSVVATLEELADLLIAPDRLYFDDSSILGAGRYGDVVSGTLDGASPTPRDVAVKKLKAVGTRGDRVRLVKRLARELKIWAKIKHPNVVELIGYQLDEKYESPMLISALMTNGNVSEYIEQYKPGIGQRIAFVKGITSGLACLHNFDPAICHADLKPANVLIDPQINAVLCDFGLASFVRGSSNSPGLVTSTAIKGTPRYMSPELHLGGECTHTLKSDMWAWACTVFEVLTGLIPYAETTAEAQFYMAIFQSKVPGDITLLLPNNMEGVDSESALALRSLYSTLPQCWDFDPQNRPSICTLLQHVSIVSSQTETEAAGNEDFASGDSQPILCDLSSQRKNLPNWGVDGRSDGLKEVTTPENPSRHCVDGQDNQAEKPNVPMDTHFEGGGATKELGIDHDVSGMKGDAASEANLNEDEKTAIQNTSHRFSLKILASNLSIFIRGLAAALILSLFAMYLSITPKG